jgi:hypothetical protein
MIALNNDVSVCLIGNDQIKILGKLQHIFEEARSVAYHASELLAFRTCLCAFLSTPTPDVANRKQASRVLLRASIMPLMRSLPDYQQAYEPQ